MAEAGKKDSGSQRVLICGDVNGKLDRLYHDVIRLQEKHGKFDFLLCCGKFLPNDKNEEFQEFVKGRKKIPIETYFIDNESDTFCGHGTSDVVALGTTNMLFFLGTHGVKDIRGVRIAHLCGMMPPKKDDYNLSFKNKNGENAYGSHFYNAGVIDHIKNQKGIGIDILLTSEWPENVMDGTDQAPQIEKSSPAVAELADFLEPRFHAAALANRFIRRTPYKSNNQKIVCRFIGLGVFDKTAEMMAQKSIHALIVCPYEKAKATLFKDSEKSTESPFKNIKLPEADKWATRTKGDLIVRSNDGKNWNVHKKVVAAGSGPFFLLIQNATKAGNSITLPEEGDVVELLLQWLYRGQLNLVGVTYAHLCRLMVLAEIHGIGKLVKQTNTHLEEAGKSFPLPADVVFIITLLNHNIQLDNCAKWYDSIKAMMLRDRPELVDALLEEL